MNNETNKISNLFIYGGARKHKRSGIEREIICTNTIRRANVLLLADENRPGGRLKEREIAEHMQVHPNRVYAIRTKDVEHGLNPTITRKNEQPHLFRIHSIASLYQALDPETARRLAKQVKIHYTPNHRSWLNIAEMDLSVMTRQCLGRPIPSISKLANEFAFVIPIKKGLTGHLLLLRRE